MCLVVIFNFIIPKQKPVKAEGVLATGIYLFFVAMCEKIGIDLIVDNENTIAMFNDFWDDVRNGLVEAWDRFIDGDVGPMTKSVQEYWQKVVYTFDKSDFNDYAESLKDWLLDEIDLEEIVLRDPEHGGYSVPSLNFSSVTPSNADGFIGFTPETAFTFSYPDNNDLDYMIYPFHDCILTIYNRYTSLPNSPYTNFGISPRGLQGYSITSSDGLSFYSINYKWYSSFSPCGSTFTLSNYRYYYGATVYSCDHWPNFSDVFNTYETNFKNSDTQCYANFFYKDSVTYVIKNSGNVYFLEDLEGNRYDDNTFDSRTALTDWFRNLCGFVTGEVSSTDIPYDPDDVNQEDEPFIWIPDDLASSVADLINSLPVDADVDVTVPKTIEAAKEMYNEHPTIYPGTIDLPISSDDMWYDRFPFCIPFDIVRLFTQFSDDSEAPQFHFVILPEDSFGLGNDEIGCDIDFSDYNILVQIMRIFLAAGFALWLLGITRKVIGS